MKIFKLVANWTIGLLLVVSVALNIFIFSVLGIKNGDSFKEALLAKELLAGFNSVTIYQGETQDVIEPVVKDDENASTFDAKLIYQDENIKITYLRKEKGPFGLDYKFLIENISDNPLTIIFNDVYVDGFKVDMSGLYCTNLEAGGKAVEVFQLYQREWEEFTTFPKKAEFKVRLVDPDSFLTIYETHGRLLFNL